MGKEVLKILGREICGRRMKDFWWQMALRELLLRLD